MDREMEAPAHALDSDAGQGTAGPAVPPTNAPATSTGGEGPGTAGPAVPPANPVTASTAGERPPQPPTTANQFAGLPAVPATHFCARCAKRLATEPGLVCCRRAGLMRCVPMKYRPRLLQLQSSALAVGRAPAGGRAAANAVLTTRARAEAAFPADREMTRIARRWENAWRESHHLAALQSEEVESDEDELEEDAAEEGPSGGE
ncbi:MAG: hypothetical protein M1826_003464 [Phylliscum demangeonii]|nr:MAG: hypothetical protein M1826_003464 [Phylliscum demangeonii]